MCPSIRALPSLNSEDTSSIPVGLNAISMPVTPNVSHSNLPSELYYLSPPCLFMARMGFLIPFATQQSKTQHPIDPHPPTSLGSCVPACHGQNVFSGSTELRTGQPWLKQPQRTNLVIPLVSVRVWGAGLRGKNGVFSAPHTITHPGSPNVNNLFIYMDVEL